VVRRDDDDGVVAVVWELMVLLFDEIFGPFLTTAHLGNK
jgi:hypothetical protein